MTKKQGVKAGADPTRKEGARPRLDRESDALIEQWKKAKGYSPMAMVGVAPPPNPYSVVGKKENKQDIRNRKVRQLMRKRTRKNDNPYVWSIGYNNCSARYTLGKVPTLSGSSLNRKIKKSANEKTKPNFPGGSKRQALAALRMAGKNYLGILGAGCAFVGVGEPENNATLFEDQVHPGGSVAGVPASISQSELLLRIPAYQLSSRSRSKIRDKITAFFRATGKHRTFATLTFVSQVDDGTAVEILNKFLTQARKKFPDLEYIWVAERQEDNYGNIHFHMMLNKFLPVGRWNAMWVIAQYNSGLRGHNAEGDEITYADVLELYRKDAAVDFRPTQVNPKTGKKRTYMQEVLNPFDIRKAKSVGRLSVYLTKYVTKQSTDTFFACRPWHCSRGVSRLFTRQLTSPSTFRYMKSFVNWGVNRDTGEMYEPKVLTGPFWTTIYTVNKRAALPFLKELEQVNRWQLAGLDILREAELIDAAINDSERQEKWVRSNPLTMLDENDYRRVHRETDVCEVPVDERGDCFWRKDYLAYQ